LSEDTRRQRCRIRTRTRGAVCHIFFRATGARTGIKAQCTMEQRTVAEASLCAERRGDTRATGNAAGKGHKFGGENGGQRLAPTGACQRRLRRRHRARHLQQRSAWSATGKDRDRDIHLFKGWWASSEVDATGTKRTRGCESRSETVSQDRVLLIYFYDTTLILLVKCLTEKLSSFVEQGEGATRNAAGTLDVP
jgi:hypothetical protein